MKRYLLSILAVVVVGTAHAQPSAPIHALARLPVKEVTVFKDGHAYVVHQGAMPVDAAGNVLLDRLPNPVLGTFWPYSANPKVKLHSVTAGRRRVTIEQTALSIRELIEANPGAEIILTENNKPAYPGTIVQLLARSSDELEANASASAELPAQKGNVLLVKTIEGTKAVNIDAITDVKFVGPYKTKLVNEEYRNLLTLKIDHGGQPAGNSAEIGMAYVQKGIRWIPNYRVELDANGKAVVKLQATLLNELTDLKDATVNLVIGVPSFYFKETADPIAMNQALVQLSPYFQSDSTSTQFALSNTMVMTQSSRMGEVRRNPAVAAAPDLGPDVGGQANEDLFVFTIKNVTLAKGQRMVLPVSEQTVDYKDVYTLDIPYAPPVEVRRQIPDAQAAELLKLLNAPKVMHKVRLTNGNVQPFTTAPALLMKAGKVIAQGMMTYTSQGATVDLTLTAAVDVRIRKNDKEVKRTANAQNFDGNSYWRIDLESSIALTNFSPKPIVVEVTRHVLGNLDKAADGVKSEKVNLLEDDGLDPIIRPAWWGYYSWPSWWGHFNGVGRVTWTAKIDPGQTNEQSYSWHYYWR